MKRRMRFMLLLSILMIVFTACEQNVEENTVTPSVEADYDWQTKGFVAEGKQTAQELFLTEYQKLDFEVENNYYGNDACVVAYGDSFFVLDRFLGEEKTTYRFQRYGVDGTVLFQTDLDANAWGIEKGSIVKMDVVDAEKLLFWVGSEYGKNEKKQWKPQHFYAVYTDYDCKLLEKVDLIDAMLTNQIWTEEDNFSTYLDCDDNGTLYFREQSTHTIFRLNSETELIGRYSYQAGERQDIQSFRMDGKEMVFACETEEGNYKYIWMNPEDGNAKQLGVTEGTVIERYLGLLGNTLYYVTGDKIVGRNIATGEQITYIDLQEHELKGTTDMVLMKTENGIKILVSEKEERYVLGFSVEQPETQGEISFVNVCREDGVLKGRVFAFTRENPLFQIDYQETYQSQEDRDRVLIDMINGNGPDVLYINQEDMENLAEKGVLGDLNSLIEDETKEVLLPGAIELGTKDGKLTGIPLSVTIHTMITNKQLWQGSSWSVADIMSIVKEREELKGLFVDVFGQDSYEYNMLFLLGVNMEETSFIKDGKSRFDCREFQELLQMVKEKSNNISVEDTAKMISDGEYLGTKVIIASMNSYGSYCKKIGENTNIVGHPTEDGSGHYLYANGLLVVNKNAMEKPAVKELVQYLLSMETQQRINGQSISVRLDVPESQFGCDDTGNEKRYFLKMPDGEMIILPTTHDGEPYLEEYVEFLKRAVPNKSNDDVFNIVLEETEKYFYSDMSTEEVVEIIQNCVQLYLDENS